MRSLLESSLLESIRDQPARCAAGCGACMLCMGARLSAALRWRSWSARWAIKEVPTRAAEEASGHLPGLPQAASCVLGRLRVSSAWRGPCAALRKAAGGEGASGASTGRCTPPAAGGGPCHRVPAPWTGQGGGAAAPRPLLLAGAALSCLVSSLEPAGSVCGVGEAAVALYCMPRRVARGFHCLPL